jgi:hypothetical protein
MRILDRLKALIQRPQPPTGAEGAPAVENGQPEDVARLDRFMRMLEHTLEEELSCEDVHRLMAQYAEALEQGQDPAKLMPLVKHHLEMCQECEEELEAVLEILRMTHQG